MPELPEVESIRRVLEELIIGKTIAEVEILREKNFIGSKNKIVGKKIVSTSRHGKYLHLELQDNTVLNIHLKMSGQLFFLPPLSSKTKKFRLGKLTTSTLPSVHTRVLVYFTDTSQLVFNDVRAFGYIKISHQKERPLGLDILHDSKSLEIILKKFLTSSRNLKTLLLDQNLLAGLGNIYACEVLFEAALSPWREGKTLTNDQIKRLLISIQKIIDLALLHRGSSIKDETYILPDFSKGQFQNFCQVYARENLSCRRCSAPIKRSKQNGRSTYFCEKCQT